MTSLRQWRLRSLLIVLLVVTAFVTSGIVGAIVLGIRLPQVEAENREAVKVEAAAFAHRIEVLLGNLQARLTLLASVAPDLAPRRLQALLDSIVGEGETFTTVYIVGATGHVEFTGLPSASRSQSKEMIGFDLSANRLVEQALDQQRPVWSDKYLSVLTGQVTVGLAVPSGKKVIVAELPMSYLLGTIRVATTSDSSLSVLVVDSRGEVVVDTAHRDQSANNINQLGIPVIQAAIEGRELPPTFMHEGSLYHPAAAYSKSIGWLFLAHTPAGFYNEGIRSLTFLVAVFFIGTTLVGLLLSPAFATRMARPLQAIIARARQIADGSAPGAWPRSAIVEYNHLSADLERMAAALKAREEEFIAIFNASPIATAVSDPANEYALIAINDAWSRQFGHARQAVIGRNGPAINLWQSMDDRAAFLQAIKGGISNREIWMLHADGTPILCNLSAQQALIGGKPVAITVTEDITEKRRIAEELRDLNTRLEERVDQRTRDLMDALERLRMAQSELVRSEKLAALGGLVAGIAHELNTPIGNGLMAVSTLHNEIVTFEESARQGLRRSIFEKFIQAINTGTDIAIRNLTRAAELVTSFKQVAIDRTSSHRRKFELIEIVTETVVTLQPMLRRSGTEVQVAVPADIMMDSYPGPLGQVMTNLLQNAVAHAFEGRSHGHVTIAAEPLATSHVRISISDDGNGIPSDQLERIFDPFFTTKMGRGGTGLGLHITHNAIVNVLGGAITVDSRIGHGTRFDIVLPLLAPAAVPEQTVASLA